MDYKKKYKEALTWVGSIYPELNHKHQMEAEAFFSELAESEDERIRKDVLDFIRREGQHIDKYKWNKWIAWLENQGGIDNCPLEGSADCVTTDSRKQGKQTFLDKPEMAFHEGDWIVQENIGVYKVIEVCESWYEVIDIEDKHYSISFDKEYMCHLWTIQDAKPGDVLVNWNNTAFIFKAIENETVKFHIAYNEKWDGIKTPSNKLSHLGLPEPQFEFHPATKEQRDTLFAKMREAGYTFDFEKKELKKIKFRVGDEKKIDIDYIKEELDKAIRIYKPTGNFGYGTLYNIATHFYELGLKA